MHDMVKRILQARVYEVARRTPLEKAPGLSASLGNDILLKREDLQPIFSFKIRGAYNRMRLLDADEKQRGVICASAGNHAQGVALGAAKLGLDAVAVMPATTPPIKVQAVRAHGCSVELHGNNFTQAAEYCEKLAHESGRVFVHPFNDPDVIAGQGTIGHELLMEEANPHVVFLPVGGGGLLAGVAAMLKWTRPEIKIVGVQAADSTAMMDSVRAGRNTELESVGLFADGTAVRRVGDNTLALARELVDDFITAEVDEICAAIKDIYGDTRVIMEPSGALAAAGMKNYIRRENLQGRTLVAICSGANMNFNRLQFVAERTETGGEKEALFAVRIPERPGALLALNARVFRGRNVTEFNYRLDSREEAEIFVGISIRDGAEAAEFSEALNREGFSHRDLTDNELAKTHVRHMVGGHSRGARNELLYRFEFPERPGALTEFLEAAGRRWNISLFHYRSHGGYSGRVLVGLEVPPEEREAFRESLNRLDFFFVDETENDAYRLFLAPS